MFDIIFAEKNLAVGFAQLAQLRGIKMSPFQCASKTRALRLRLAAYGPIESFSNAAGAIEYVIGGTESAVEARDLSFVLGGCLTGAAAAHIQAKAYEDESPVVKVRK